jgi:predicted nucleic acid-binding protein
VKFVLDTNAVSELVKRRSNDGFLLWHDSQDAANLFITTVTLGEVWQGFHKLPLNHRDHDRIKKFALELPRGYRILKLDERAAVVWGEMVANASGPLPIRDSYIAAVARSRGCRVVTRDSEVFERMGCKVVNPWT